MSQVYSKSTNDFPDQNKSFSVLDTIYITQSGQRLYRTKTARHPETISFFLSQGYEREFQSQIDCTRLEIETANKEMLRHAYRICAYKSPMSWPMSP